MKNLLTAVVYSVFILVLLIAGCSKGTDPTSPSSDEGITDVTEQTVDLSQRTILSQFFIYVNMETEDVYIERALAPERIVCAGHQNLRDDLLNDSYCGADLDGPCIELDVQFESGDGTNLDAKNGFRLMVNIINDIEQIYDHNTDQTVYDPDLLDVRIIFNQEYLDTWNMAFISPNAYTQLGDGAHYHPYRTFRRNDPDRRLYNWDDDQYNSRALENCLFMVGTDSHFDADDMDDTDPPDASNGYLIMNAWVTGVVWDGVGTITYTDHVEEPYAILAGVGENERLIDRIVDSEVDQHVFHTYRIYDYQGWAAFDEDDDVTVDLSDFANEPDFEFSGVQTSGTQCQIQTHYTFDCEDPQPGGLYEVPLTFADGTNPQENYGFLNEPWITDTVEYYHYFFQLRIGEEVTSVPGSTITGFTPVSTSPRFIDMTGNGDYHFIAVYQDQVVTKISEDGNTCVSWYPMNEHPLYTPNYTRYYCLGAPAFSDQNDDGVLDVIIGFLSRYTPAYPYESTAQGRVFCIDGDDWDTLWSFDYSTGQYEGNGDVVASPMIAELDDSNDAEEVVIMLDHVEDGNNAVSILQYDSGNVSEIGGITFQNDNYDDRICANGALVEQNGDTWLSFINLLDSGTELCLYDISDPNEIDEITTKSLSANDSPVDILNIGFVSIGPVIGNVTGGSYFEVILALKEKINIYTFDGSDLDEYTSIKYGKIDATQYDNPDDLLEELSEPSEYKNCGSLPSLGDMNHNGRPDIIFCLRNWIVCLTYVNDEWDDGPRFDSLFCHYDANGEFRGHSALADMTRDGFLDVIAGSGRVGTHNVVAIDGSPFNNSKFGDSDNRQIWKWFHHPSNESYTSLGQGPALMNGTSAGDYEDYMLVGCTWTKTQGVCRSTFAILNTEYEAQGIHTDYSPPTGNVSPFNNPEYIAWPWYLADRFNSACYYYPQ